MVQLQRRAHRARPRERTYLKEHPETFTTLDAALRKKLNIGSSVAPVVSEPNPSVAADPKPPAKPAIEDAKAQEEISFADAEPVLA
jgi:hypothetical protein